MKRINKKHLLKTITAVLMAMSLLVCCVACGADNSSNSGKYDGLTDAEYFQALAKEEMAGMSEMIAAGVGAYANMSGASGNSSYKAQLNLTLGEPCIDSVEQAIFGTTESGMDLSFLTDINMDMELDSNNDLTQLQVALGLNDTEILALYLLLSQESAWIGIPEMNDEYLQVNLAELGLNTDMAQSAWINLLLEAIPSEETTAMLLNRYIALAVAEIDKVERTQATLEQDDQTQNVTQLTAKIYEQDALDAAKVILTALKADQDVKKIIDDYTVTYNKILQESDPLHENVDLYPAFVKMIDDALEDLPEKAENTHSYVSVVLYVNDKHDIILSRVDIPADLAGVNSWGNEMVSLEIKTDIKDRAGSIEVKLVTEEEMIITAEMTIGSKTPEPVQKPTNTVNVNNFEAFMGWVGNFDITAMVDNLRQAGVPEILVMILRNMFITM